MTSTRLDRLQTTMFVSTQCTRICSSTNCKQFRHTCSANTILNVRPFAVCAERVREKCAACVHAPSPVNNSSLLFYNAVLIDRYISNDRGEQMRVRCPLRTPVGLQSLRNGVFGTKKLYTYLCGIKNEFSHCRRQRFARPPSLSALRFNCTGRNARRRTKEIKHRGWISYANRGGGEWEGSRWCPAV